MAAHILLEGWAEARATLRELVLAKLKDRGLRTGELQYRGFSADFLDAVLRWGTESPSSRFVYANPEMWLGIDPDPDG